MRHPLYLQACNHPECATTQQKVLQSDQYIGLAPRIASQDYPCPQDLECNSMNLSFLLTCRLIYYEARRLPYARTVFFTQEVGSFSNFPFCLWHWQVQSLRYLKIRVPPEQGMDTHLAEWNETFSLISLGFPNLAAISIQIHLRFPMQTVRDTFWDGGLLELCNLRCVQGMRLSVFKFDSTWPPTEDPDIFFAYSAGSLPSFMEETSGRERRLPVRLSSLLPPDEHICFRRARDRLRDQVRQDASISEEWASHDSYHSGQLFFRFSPNAFPLYVRHLIHALPRRWPHRTHADIRREDRLHTNKTEYAYVYREDPSCPELPRQPIFGFQFNPNTTLKHNDEYIARGLAALRLSRERLSRKQLLRSSPPSSSSSGLSNSCSTGRQRDENDTRPSLPLPGNQGQGEPRYPRYDVLSSARQRRASPVVPEVPHSRREVTPAENEKPGDWRRRLTEEAFAPFIESLHMALS
ncbi:uncharacterized protein BO97DRAFT_385410 [Aspergillus homomorphus CBS 101889]|uniref:Uncharacterized protein n=1 Tax=Aspergillus homomorphus (strain CBS 101889) TaxID=1450537 RepID=A0A395I4W7_ASPHC|nr:hypothetical protein BO97DRAFT_385410 [Aspergillus homomorphus CBS 101889]RAL15130.1 hypothetical protein BO97DRAFT_385410 [Aspergillus homomorphus CBS 101889]